MTVVVVEADRLARAVTDALRGAGADEASSAAAVRAMMHASTLGVDSHGVRLVDHYTRMLRGGRVNGRPQLAVERRAAGSAVVDADHGLGHYGAYRAVEEGCAMAREAGIAGIAVMNSSHFGAAGAYALAGAEAGFVTFATTNSDSMVALHGGAGIFHGTNPLAFAAPVPDARPWLFDMATSSIPMNRVWLYRSLGTPLPEGVAADAAGMPTRDPVEAAMLLPLGGTGYGHKGAGLGGVATLFSAMLTGMMLDADLLPFEGEDTQTPRCMGHFVIVVDPEHFAGGGAFGASITRYLAQLRGAPTRPGETLMAAGDREWQVAQERRSNGIPVDPDTAKLLGFV